MSRGRSILARQLGPSPRRVDVAVQCHRQEAAPRQRAAHDHRSMEIRGLNTRSKGPLRASWRGSDPLLHLRSGTCSVTRTPPRWARSSLVADTPRHRVSPRQSSGFPLATRHPFTRHPAKDDVLWGTADTFHRTLCVLTAAETSPMARQPFHRCPRYVGLERTPSRGPPIGRCLGETNAFSTSLISPGLTHQATPARLDDDGSAASFPRRSPCSFWSSFFGPPSRVYPG